MKITMNDQTGFQYVNGDGDKLSIQFGLNTVSDGWCSSCGIWEASEVEVALLNSEFEVIYGPWERVSVTLLPTIMLLFRSHDHQGLAKLLHPHSLSAVETEAPESWDHSDDADALASAGWGTNEDYGDHGCGDD